MRRLWDGFWESINPDLVSAGSETEIKSMNTYSMIRILEWFQKILRSRMDG